MQKKLKVVGMTVPVIVRFSPEATEISVKNSLVEVRIMDLYGCCEVSQVSVKALSVQVGSNVTIGKGVNIEGQQPQVTIIVPVGTEIEQENNQVELVIERGS